MKRSGFKKKRTVPLKRTKLRKVSKRGDALSTKTLHKKAWETFSKWVRNRDKKCVTCGSIKNLQAGHYFHAILDFDEININAQCSACNKWRQGNLTKYAVYLVNKYGIEVYSQLVARHYLAMRGEKKTVDEYQELIKKYSMSSLNTICEGQKGVAIERIYEKGGYGSGGY